MPTLPPPETFVAALLVPPNVPSGRRAPPVHAATGGHGFRRRKRSPCPPVPKQGRGHLSPIPCPSRQQKRGQNVAETMNRAGSATKMRVFCCRNGEYGQQSGARRALSRCPPQRPVCSRRRCFIPAAVPNQKYRLMYSSSNFFRCSLLIPLCTLTFVFRSENSPSRALLVFGSPVSGLS